MRERTAAFSRALTRIAELVVKAAGPLIVGLTLLLVLSIMFGGRWEEWVVWLWLAFIVALALFAVVIVIVRLLLWRFNRR